MFKRTKVINFIGCPGSGKSTAALAKAAELKRQGHSVYFVPEYATDLILEGKEKELKDQRKLFKEQAKRLIRAHGKVDYIVCECPIIMNLVYARFMEYKDPELEQEILRMHKAYESEDIYLKPKANYSQLNRVHTREEALQIDTIIKEVLKEAGEVYCNECKKISKHPVKYGNLVMNYCEDCRNSRVRG